MNPVLRLGIWLANLRGSGGVPLGGRPSDWGNAFFGTPSTETVTERQALTNAAVFGAIRTIATALAQVPVEVRNRTNPRPDVPNDHVVERLLNIEPSPRFSGPALTEWIVKNIIVSGNAYVLIDRAPGGGLRSLWPLRHDNVEPYIATNGRVRYRIQFQSAGDWYDGLRPPPGAPSDVDQDMMLHFHGLDFDGLCGRSALQLGMSRAVATDIQMSRHANATFSRGALQQFAMTTDKKIDPEMAKQTAEAWQQMYQGGVGTSQKLIVLGQGNDLKQLQMTARDLQMNELRDVQISDILRSVGVPGSMMNQENKSTSWGTGILQFKQGFLTFTVQEYVTRIEAELNRKLFGFTSEFAKLRTDRLLRGTTIDRYKAHEIALRAGFKTINEVRMEEDDAPFDDEKYDLPQENRGGMLPQQPMEDGDGQEPEDPESEET